MKKTKFKEKGITLIALVITIVVLIILATISINMILNDDGIIGAAELTKEKYQNASKEEQTDLGNLEEIVDNYREKWVYDSETQTVTKGDLTLKIGQKIEYDEGTAHTTTPDTTRGAGSSYSSSTKTLSTKQYTNENLEWRVLGANEKGQLELISTNVTTDTLTLYGKQGYLNALTKDGVKGTLDTFCHELYGQGVGAESARSLNVDDINKFANFNSKTDRVYTFKYDSNTSTVKYTTDPTKDISKWTDTGVPTITTPYWKVDSTTVGEETLTHTLYSYQISEKITGKIENDTISLADFLYKGENWEEIYWGPSTYLASSFAYMGSGYFFYGVRDIEDEYISENMMFWVEWLDGSSSNQLEEEKIEEKYNTKVLRPVVTLKSNVQLQDTDNNGILNVK